MCFGGVWLASTVKMEYVGLLASGAPSKNTICIHVFLAVRPEQHTHTKLHMCTSDFLAGNCLPVLHQAWNKLSTWYLQNMSLYIAYYAKPFSSSIACWNNATTEVQCFLVCFFVVFDLQKVCFLQLGINKEKPKLVCLISFFNSLNLRAFRNVL